MTTAKPLPLVRRLTPRMMAATVLFVIALLGGTYFLTRRALEPPKQHDPVSVVIADFENRTNDPTFDRTLEPMLKRALEGAGFISAYDRSGNQPHPRRPPPEKLDEVAARELAVKQGLGVVLSGSTRPTRQRLRDLGQGDSGGHRQRDRQRQRQGLEQGPGPGGRDETGRPRCARRSATRRRSPLRCSRWPACRPRLWTSCVSMRRRRKPRPTASSTRRCNSASKAVELDPKFGVGYQLMAVASRNQGKQQDAEKYINEALQYLDGMTERERYTTRGFFFRVTGDYPQCVKEYGELIARYAADVVGHNQLRPVSRHSCETCRRAVDEMRQVVAILPNRVIFRDNLALYANYAGDFQTGEKEARSSTGAATPMHCWPWPLPSWDRVSCLRPGKPIRSSGRSSALGASFAASGLGDLAALEGRFSDAVRILRAGCGPGLDGQESRSSRREVRGARLRRSSCGDRQRAAIEAAEKALANSKAVKIRFLAARVFVEAGEIARARTAHDRTDCRAPGRASGLRQDRRRRARAEELEIRARRSRS